MTRELPPIAQLLPQSGAMIMIDAIVEVDAAHIVCTTLRHHARDNPLRQDGVLRALAGIEFAAQAMALHGAVCRTPPAALSFGRVASVRDVEVARERLDEVDGPLIVRCTLDSAAGTIRAYRFELASGAVAVLSGWLVVTMSDGGQA
jgi:predicted hotdog family 3-hydroxylacyl-ACP dehydratase